MRKKIAALVIALGIFAVQALPALACGGLIAPDGDVRLQNATTLIAWHNGIEHYLTTFTYAGSSTDLGWIVPLPAVPLQIQDGGAWTLQRLEIASHPVTLAFGAAQTDSAAAPSATVLQRVKIEALNITVIRGSGPEIINWATGNNFFLNDDTRNHLLTYAKGSPIFMAVKFDTSAAKARGQLQGDGTPILITMKIPHIWVPLEVLALDGQQVQADLFLLTDNPVYTSDFSAFAGQSSVGSTIGNAQGFTMPFQEQIDASLYHDLSTDRNMGWVWPNSWLTYLTLNAPSEAVTYDMGVASSGVIRLAPFGTPPMAVVDSQASHSLPSWVPEMPLGTPQFLIGTIIVLTILASSVMFLRHRRRTRTELAA
ncbi:MAG TPA: DUF2330 domain-containing protein [Ktedonobacteraceae bacterium]|nr:DUF2330 domain-containing protein [Ktedonobacteraceae bacterium]